MVNKNTLLSPTSSPSIDDLIDEWHNDPKGMELHEYLGMTRAEYAGWLCDPTYKKVKDE